MTTITTATGLTHEVASAPGSCREIVDLGAVPTRYCAEPARRYALDLRHLDRGSLREAFCEAHGGTDRALRLLAESWMAAAPASVGDAAAVEQAGALSLTSRAVYVVVRPEHGIWLAWIGIGSHLLQVANPAGGKLSRDGRPLYHRTASGEKRWRGAMSFRSAESAESAAVDAWRKNVAESVERIRRARGETLSWGLPVKPRTEPIVLKLGEHGSAWDAVTRGEV